jgi:MFS family permease
LLQLRLIAIPTYRTNAFGGSFFRIGINAVALLFPLLMQDQFGWSPLKAGAVMISVFVGNLGVKPFTVPLLRRFGFRTVLVGSGISAIVTLLICALLTANTPLALILIVFFATGLFRSIGLTCYNTITFADVPASELNNANTLFSTLQQLMIGIGVAAGGLALRVAGPIAAGLHVSDVGSGKFAVALVLLAVVTAGAVIESLRLPPDAGHSVSQRSAARTVSPSEV